MNDSTRTRDFLWNSNFTNNLLLNLLKYNNNILFLWEYLTLWLKKWNSNVEKREREREKEIAIVANYRYNKTLHFEDICTNINNKIFLFQINFPYESHLQSSWGLITIFLFQLYWGQQIIISFRHRTIPFLYLSKKLNLFGKKNE